MKLIANLIGLVIVISLVACAINVIGITLDRFAKQHQQAEAAQ